MLGLELETAGFVAAFARTSAWAHTAPLIADRTVPRRVRVAVAALAAVVVSAARPPLAPQQLWVALPGEILFGLMAGLLARVVLAGAEAGGQLIGVQIGLGFAGVLDPDAREDMLPTRKIAFGLAGFAFLAADGLERSIQVLAVAPAPVQGPTLIEAAQALIASGTSVMVAAIRFAAPVLIAGVVANLAVAVASRAAPALNVFSVTLALVLIVSLATLIATAPGFVHELMLTGERASGAVVGMVRR